MQGKPIANRRLGRRRFIGLGAAATAGLALSAIACSPDSNKPGATATRPASGATAPALGASPTRPAAQVLGQTLRYTGFVTGDGNFDPHKTQVGPFSGQQSLVYSRLLSYASQVDGTIEPDLALAMPERPDAVTCIFKLNPQAFWHDAPPLNGRPVTGEDVKFSLMRQATGDVSFPRKAQWANIETIEVPGGDSVVVKLKTPMANSVNLFADVNALIVAPQAAEAGFTAERQIGSGPFRWLEWSEGKFASVTRNPRWHGGAGRPTLGGVSLVQAQNSEEIEAKLRVKAFDVAFLGRGTAEKLKPTLPDLVETSQTLAQFYGMRFFLPQFPYNDQRFRSAVNYALDRRAMLKQFFGDAGEVNPWVSTAIRRWSLPQSELATMAGYRPGAEGRAADLAEARELLTAFRSQRTMPDELPLFVVDEAEKAIKLGTVIRDQLRIHLELPVKIYPISIKELGARVFSQTGPWAAAPDTGWVDLDDWVYPYFHSAGTNNSFALKDPEMDSLIEAQRTQLDDAQRRELGFQLQRRLHSLAAGINLVSETVLALRWPYVSKFPFDATDGYQHRFADCQIDTTHPSFRGR